MPMLQTASRVAAMVLLVLASGCGPQAAPGPRAGEPTAAMEEAAPAPEGEGAVPQPPPEPAPEPPPEPGETSPEEAAYSCFGPPIPGSVWAAQEPAADVEHPGRSVLLEAIGARGLEGWFLLEVSPERLAVAREREVAREPHDDALRTHDVVTVTDFGGDTGWHLEQWSSCTPRLVHDDVGPAEVWLDGEPDPDAHEVDLLVVEQACAGGQPAHGRVELIRLVEREDAVEVIVGVQGRPGVNTCPSNPATPFPVRLERPLGDRPVIDGSVHPPRPLDVAPDDLRRG
jgi:hypothetical protein